MRSEQTYEGRVLPRPDEEIVDQGLAFDLGTLVARRHVLRALGLSAVTFGLAACGSTPGSPSASSPQPSPSTGGVVGEIPDETAGPFPGDGSNGPDVLNQSGVVRDDIRSSFGGASGTAEGVPLTLELTIVDMANGDRPLTGAAVYVWHCDREGRYSLYSHGVTDQNYLRGVQIADDQGRVRFTSIFPGCYTGRWPHIHFEVYPDQAQITDSANAIATSQVALPEDVCTMVYAQPGYEASVTSLSRITLESDNVFGEDRAARQLATVTGDVTGGFTAALPVGIDTRTSPRAGGPGGPDGTPSGVPRGPDQSPVPTTS